MINLVDWKIVNTVCKTRNFTAAAELLYLTQPDVSKRIHKVEKDFQVKLFTRNYHHLELTATGKIFYQYSAKILGLHQQLLADINDHQLKQVPSQTLKVGLLITKDTAPYIKKFSAFAQQHPNVNMAFDNLMSNEVVKSVRAKSLDIGISIVIPQTELSWMKLFNDEFVIVRDKSKPQTHSLKSLQKTTCLTMADALENPVSKHLIAPRKFTVLKNIDEIVTNLLVQDSYSILAKNIVQSLHNPNLAYTRIQDYPRKQVHFATGLVYRTDNPSPIIPAILRSFA